jgi:hypothetical protein
MGDRYTPAADGEAAIHAAGTAVNRRNPSTEDEIRAALSVARAAALVVKSRFESTDWQVGQFTGLNISPFQNWLYEKNRDWHFTDGTLCVLWCLEFPEAKSDYARHHKYIVSTRRDYNNGKHFADSPAIPSVAYDRFGNPAVEAASAPKPPVGSSGRRDQPRSQPCVRAHEAGTSVSEGPSGVAPAAKSTSRLDAGTGRLATDPTATARRLAAIESYMASEVLGTAGFVCQSYEACRQSHDGLFFEGQLHHVGRHFDVSVDGRPFRIAVIGQEYGNGPAGVRMAARYEDVAIRTGLGKRFRKDGIHEARNHHMRGTTSLLRLLFGREIGDRHEDEFWDVDGQQIHLFDMFALVNFLLCSAIDAEESETGSKHGRSTPIMQRNCGRHFTRVIEILEPTLVVVQGMGVLRWMAPVMRDEGIQSATLRHVRIGRHRTLLAALSHPSAQAYNWADLPRPYLHQVVAPTVLQARRMLLDVAPDRV